MPADLVVVGDSHTLALHQAALARGLDSRMLYISGNFWNENRMRPHGTLGINANYRRGLGRKVNAFAQEQGGSVFPPGVPIVASIGYHLGRMAPLLARHGHSPDPVQCAADESRSFLSSAFLRGWVMHHRGTLFRLLRLAARQSPMVVVAPPVIQVDPVAHALRSEINLILRGSGLSVFDPAEEPDWTGHPLPQHLRAPDNGHGNAQYGEEVLRRIHERGLLIQAP